MKQPCAVLGVGQTHHAAKRDDVSIPGLVREAALRALEDAGLEFGDIDAVVLGKAPDTFEGVITPELSLAGALAAGAAAGAGAAAAPPSAMVASRASTPTVSPSAASISPS